ncbi:SDR family NAD(P)-dependent oxidoreductase [Alkalicoccus urumqiensis]|uniref:Oxidoreductase n=1 Tax=Alkalicoccus urumqiensis TaxID=1548213 RepID=A0A2P6MKF0_ALKUR|nr:SDR family NAD(P)-dependent oxidoreductase [Alkalicoccus urumqiensis]PRO66748.1 oxidoreductase [Alkalicoccus urumqiensis]
MNIVITGASSGLGAETAALLAAEGHRVILGSRSIQKLKEVKKRIQSEGGSCEVYALDVTNEQSCVQFMKQAEENNGSVDILINNAGAGTFKKIEELQAVEVEEMLSVNVTGVHNMTKAALPYMKARDQGKLLFISSLAGKIPSPKASVYAASKHAVIGYARAVRMELAGTNVNVSIFYPGPIDTPFLDKADKTGNYRSRLGRMMLTVRETAVAVGKLTEKKSRESHLPKVGFLLSVLYQTAPKIVEKAAGKQFQKK